MKKRCYPANLVLFALALAGGGLAAEDGTLRISGTGSALGVIQELGRSFEKTQRGVKIKVLLSIGSTGGIRAVGGGRLDLACSSRPLTAEEAARGLQEHPFASTPFVFAVQKSNPVSDLGFDEIVHIYAGGRTTWSPGAPLRLVLRPRSDTAHQFLSSLSPAMARALDRAHATPGAFVALTDQDSAQQLEKTSGAFGTCTLGLILSERRALKAISVSGVQPSLENLASGRYSFATKVVLVTHPKPLPPPAEAFLRFLQSKPARDTLRKYGFLPESPLPPQP